MTHPSDPHRPAAGESERLAAGVRYEVASAPTAPPLSPEAQQRVAARVAAARAAARTEQAELAATPGLTRRYRRAIIAGLGLLSLAVAGFGAVVLATSGFQWGALGPTLLFAAEALDCALALRPGGRERWPMGLAWLP